MTLRELVAAIRRHVLLVGGIASLALAAAAYSVYREHPIYRATAVIRLTDTGRALTRVGDSPATETERRVGSATDPLISEIQILQSRALAGKVVDEEGLRVQAESREEAIHDLLENLSVRPREKTDVVDIDYSARDPRLAQRVANAVTVTFKDMSTQAAREEARQRRLFIEQQLQRTDSLLQEKQLALIAFRKREQVYSSQASSVAQLDDLLERKTQLTELEADRIMYQSLLTGLRDGGPGRAASLRTLVSSPEIASNPTISKLYAQLAEYETTRDSLTAGRWGSAATHPDVQRLTSLISSTESNLVNAVRSHIASLTARIRALSGIRAQMAAEIRSLPGTEAEEARLVHQVETVRKTADQLREEHQKARIAEAVEMSRVEIVDWAALPHHPVESGPATKLLLGLMVGLVLGGGAAFVREATNNSIRRREELEEVLKLPGLAVIPQHSPVTDKGLRLPILGRSRRPHPVNEAEGALITLSDARSPAAEAFRMLRTNLIFSQSDRKLDTIVVTSSAASEGKTTIAANLAVVSARTGKRVALVDCDLIHAPVHKLFGVKATPGLCEVLQEQVSLTEALHATTVDTLAVLPAGSAYPNPDEMLSGTRMLHVLSQLAGTFDLIILDVPAVLQRAEAATLAAAADGVLLVVRAGKTERGVAQRALQELALVGASVVGAVLNDPGAHGTSPSAQPRSGAEVQEVQAESIPAAEEERLQHAGEHGVWAAEEAIRNEEEEMRNAEAERLRRVEEEQARRAEEERLRKAREERVLRAHEAIRSAEEEESVLRAQEAIRSAEAEIQSAEAERLRRVEEQARRVEEERLRKAEEESVLRAHEAIRSAEAERLRRVEAEQARRAEEEERLRKAEEETVLRAQETIRSAEAEIRSAEAERLRRVEEEQARRAEEERLRKVQEESVLRAQEAIRSAEAEIRSAQEAIRKAQQFAVEQKPPILEGAHQPNATMVETARLHLVDPALANWDQQTKQRLRESLNGSEKQTDSGAKDEKDTIIAQLRAELERKSRVIAEMEDNLELKKGP